MSINVETLAAANAYTAASLKGAGALQGKPGKDGPEGKSAYQVALDNGFVGTEAQWLASLVGNGMTPEAQKQLGDNTTDVLALKQADDFMITGQLVDNIQNVADNGAYKLYHRADAVLGKYLNVDTASKTISDMENTKYGYVFIGVEPGKQYTLKTRDEFEYVGRLFDVASGTYTKTSYLWAGWGNSGTETVFTVPDWGRFISIAFRLKTQASVTGIVNDTFIMWEDKVAEAFDAKVNRAGQNEISNSNAVFIVSKNAFNTAVGYKENTACYDGVEVARDGYCTTYPFVDLLAGQTYTITKSNGTQFLIFITFYRADMSFIQRWYVDAKRGTFTVPEGTVYAKASFAATHLGTFQVNEGGVSEPFVPYGSKYALAKSIEVPERVIHVNKDGTGDYTSLTEGILKATEGMDYTVYVGAGVYDLIEEFLAYYGADFFTTHASGSLKGVILKNRVKIVFSSGSLVRCHYNGDNDSVMIRFSPFNAGPHGFTLTNMKLECSRVRYAVHDEMHVEEDPYRNVYENCDMLIDNSNNTAWAGKACIGGGLGIHGDVVVRDSVFNSVESVDRYLVTYHNSEDANHKGAKSNVVVTGCYIGGKNGINASWFGPSTEITKFVLTNNNVGVPTRVHPETSDGTSPVVNVEVLEWGTIVRS